MGIESRLGVLTEGLDKVVAMLGELKKEPDKHDKQFGDEDKSDMEKFGKRGKKDMGEEENNDAEDKNEKAAEAAPECVSHCVALLCIALFTSIFKGWSLPEP